MQRLFNSKILGFFVCCIVIYLTTLADNLPTTWRWASTPILFIAVSSGAVQLLSAVSSFWPKKESSSFEKASERPFPFEVIENTDELDAVLFPPLGSTSILDADVPLIYRGTTRLEHELDKKNRVILVGRSKLGKTRLMTEILKSKMLNGAAILVLKRYHWFYQNFIPPESLRGRKEIVIAIDDLNHYLNFKLPSDSGDSMIPFHNILDNIVKTIRNTCGRDTNIEIIITAKPEQDFWKTHEQEAEFWQSFELMNILPMTSQETKELIQKLSAQTGIEVSPDVIQELASRNDGTFLPLILAFRRWKSLGVNLLGINEVASFEGQLRKVWPLRLNQLAQQSIYIKNIYAVIDLLRNQNIAPSVKLVEELTTLLSLDVVTLFTSHWNRLFSHYFTNSLLDKTEKYWRKLNAYNVGILYFTVLVCAMFLLRLGGRQLLLFVFIVLMLVLFVYAIISSAVILTQSVSSNRKAQARKTIQLAIQHYIKSEIPVTNEVFYPYDGQVDGTSINIPMSKLSSVIKHRHQKHWGSRLLAVSLLEIAKELQWTNREETLRILELCIEIDPKMFDAYLLAGQIYQSQGLSFIARDNFKQILNAGPATFIPESYAELGLVELQMKNLRTSNKIAELALRTTGNGILTKRSRFLSCLCARKDIRTLEKAANNWARSAPDTNEISMLVTILNSIDIDNQRIYHIESVKRILQDALHFRSRRIPVIAASLYESYTETIKSLFLYPNAILIFSLTMIILLYPFLFTYAPSIIKPILNAAIFIENDIPWLYTQRALSYALMERPNDCIDDSAKAYQLNPADPFVYYAWGTCYYDNNPRKAIDFYSTALSLDSKSQSNSNPFSLFLSYSAENAYFLRGTTYQKEGNAFKAILDFTSAIELSQWHPEYYLQRGNAYFDLQKYQLAIQDFTNVIQMPTSINESSQKGDAYYSRGFVYYSQGKIEDALRDFDMAINSDRGNGEVSDYSLARAYYLRGLIELDKEDFASALQDCNKAKIWVLASKDRSLEADISQCINEANAVINAEP